MPQAMQNGFADSQEVFHHEQAFAETPFVDTRLREQEDTARELSTAEMFNSNWEFTTPFLPGEMEERGESENLAPEIAEFSELTGELKDTLFREALEQLANEAMEAHESQIAGEYGDHESRDLTSQRLLNDHFAPLAMETEALLDRFFERLEGYEAESLTDTEIERISAEVMPIGEGFSPASDQFLRGLLRKAGRLVSGAVKLAKKGVAGAVNLAGKGLAAIGKLALGPLLKPLKMLGKFLLQHVVRFALGQLPPALRPLAQTLSQKLSRALGETYENEEQEQSMGEAMPAASDAARLEAEFDVQAAQLLLTPNETDREQLVESYGEGESYTSPLAALDDTRMQLVKSLSRLQPGDSPQPVMEQFLPALVWPAAKTAITLLGRPKLVSFIGRLLSGLIKPLIGEEAAGLLAPAIADAGLRIFGLETANTDPRMLAAEALAATVEETINSVAELPTHVLENELLLSDAVHEAFENAAAAYFPNSVIKPELRESSERYGTWARMPARSGRKRYAKYSDAVPVEIPARLARTIETFDGSTLHDHLRDHYGHQDGRPYKSKVSLYQALPGTRGSTIARAEGFPASQLHPLTPQAAGVLLGQNASLGLRQTSGRFMATPERLHLNQRLYRLEPPTGRHALIRHVHSELAINLQRGEIRLWLYLSEPLCQRMCAELAKGNQIAAFAGLKRLLRHTTEALRTTAIHRHMPHRIHVIGDRPSLNGLTPGWLKHASHHLAAKIGEWGQAQLAQYVRNSSEEFKRACASHHDGVTLRITMTRVPGMEILRLLAQGRGTKDLTHTGWPQGSPAFQVVQHTGYKIHRLRN